MKRIIFAALILTFVTGAAFSAPKSKKATALKQTAAKQAAVSTVPLSALFPAATGESITDAKGMVSIAAPAHEVVLVRINADGTRSHACVDNETAARNFMAGQKTVAPATEKQAH
ncbi:MAG TPA: hypothetical protein VHX14_03945 [Thermoanaerobaculia bacterium]|jgi:formate hydrogenlyase subunit 3/multisubunit Na+/H+ antiporter MnhD subunit|nr:hypothetical protein [Thermoanaerobaculia bacterium]